MMPSFTGSHNYRQQQQQQTSYSSSSRFRSGNSASMTGSSRAPVRPAESRYQRQNSDREDSWIEVSSQPSDDTHSSDNGSDDDDFEDGSGGGLVMHQGHYRNGGAGGVRNNRKKKARRVEIPLSGSGTGRGLSATNTAATATTVSASTSTSPFLSASSSSSKLFDHSADDLSEVEMIESSGPGSSIGELPTAEDMVSSSEEEAGGEDGSSEEGVIEDSSDGEDTGTMLGVGYRSNTFQQASRSGNVGDVSGGSRFSATAASRFSNQSVHEFQRAIQPPSQSFLRHRNSHSGASGSSSSRYFRPSPPATKADHDEALMASLSTLLSVAAAARSLPKVSQQSGSPSGPSRAPTMSSSRVQLDTLQLVANEMMSEKEGASSPGGMNEEIRAQQPTTLSTPPSKEEQTTRPSRQDKTNLQRTSSSTSISSTSRSSRKQSADSTGKKSSQRSPSTSGGKHHSRRRSASPKSTAKRDYKLTSTLSSADASLVTLALAAGGVILLSAISFSAGYAMGREVGKNEADTVMGAVMGRSGGVVREVSQRGGRGLVVGSVGRVVSVGA